MTVSPSTTVADLVAERPARARLFEQLGLDYCCGGKRSLDDACRAKGLDAATVATMLGVLDRVDGTHDDLADATLGGICDHIVSVHHELLRTELPRLSALLAKVVKAHGEERPELVPVQATYEELRTALEHHLVEEEVTTFPALRALDAGDAQDDLPARIEHLEVEHDHAGQLLARLSELTDGYSLAGVGCNTHRATLDALADLQGDLHLHIHEENNVLFPRAAAALATR